MVNYIGLPRSGGVSIQTEAAVYFARMTTAPSAGYKTAFNDAVYEWKRQGTWTLIKGLWVHCADTQQAALLSVIGDTPRDATLTGTPTFTALKGFSGFSAANQVNWPITSAILASDSVFAFGAGIATLQTGPVIGNFIDCDAGTGNTIPGNFLIETVGVTSYVTTVSSRLNTLGQQLVGASCQFIGGSHGNPARMILPGMHAGTSGVPGSRSSNYKTRALANTPLNRMCAYGFLDASVTAAQAQKFLTVLSKLINDVGAFD